MIGLKTLSKKAVFPMIGQKYPGACVQGDR